MCEMKINPCLFFYKRRALPIDCLRHCRGSHGCPALIIYTQFIALYVVIAAFNLLLHSVILWVLKIIERNLKTYLSWSKTQWEFHRSLQKSTDEKKCPLSSSLSSLIGQKNAGSRWQARFPAIFLISSTISSIPPPRQVKTSYSNAYIGKLHF